MPYKPKYCCQCAEKIERIDWKPWTSRRFCELCETEFGVNEWLARGLFGIGLLLGVFGIGVYLQKPEKPLSVAPNQFVGGTANNKNNSFSQKSSAAPVSANVAVQPVEQTNVSVSQIKSPAAPAVSDLKARQIESSANEASEKVYFCGAITKKGTLCSRRVKGGGRCWQHAGQPAMVSQEKLLASQ